MYQLSPADLITGRNYLDLTQGELADALHTTRVCVTRYEAGARTAPEHYVQGLRELCEAHRCQLDAQSLVPVPEAKARPPVPPAPAVAGFDLSTAGGLKALAKQADKLLNLPPKDFENLTVRLNEIAATSYDEKVRLRALDILAKLTLASAKVGGMPGDVPAPTEGEAYDHMADLSDRELAVMAYLDRKARGEVFAVPTPDDLSACLAWLADGGTTKGIERAAS